MKRLFAFIIVISMTLLLFTSCGGKGKKTDAQDMLDVLDDLPVELGDDTKDLLNDIAKVDIPATDATAAKIKISATLPEGWSEEAKSNSIASYIKDTNMVEVFEAWAPSEVKDLKGLAEFEQESIKKYFEDAVFYDMENDKLAGLDAIRMPIDISISKTFKQRQTYIYFKKGGQYFKLMFAHFTDEEQGVKDIEAIIDSMKIE
ncbi:MAG: hypothetical protein PHC69_06230 [Ruminiclostridium sp.]|nr:hypothetical protein [Ruminiclostridium sp.]